MFTKLITLALPIALAMSAVPRHADAQTVTLKFAHFLPSTSNFQRTVAEPWCADIEKDSGGRLKCQLYPSLQLGGTPPQLADQVKSGVADIVWTSPSYNTGRFPRTEALELPFTLPPDSLRGSKAMWAYTQQFGMEDFKDYKLLALFSASNVIISTASKPVLDLAQIKGLKLRSPTRFSASLLTALGATPVSMPPAQVTEGISKGVIDGVLAPWELLPAVKIDEVTRYHMEGAPGQPGFAQSPLSILMNKARYDSLPTDLKAVIDKHSGAALVERAARSWDGANAEARKKALAQGNKVLVIKDDDYNAIKAASATVVTDWIKQADEKGLGGVKLVEAARALAAKSTAK
ncbi:TRAP transporter substrate-binding protein [Rhizobacter sp. AJA081-3]|uniref:TRAP transporter substrate-binding protein n=1 Tax=Rhizobacter sp. AJA081-3 TaxID=2753607 RepID=UPI001AE05801|nr:TRAP transporter substrate-binding protein [Rhizobacter sp. AJA081-3]QTN25728.1 TRAP transporter substrate-binding protein [Rhizobacter sp. AJA081-3]